MSITRENIRLNQLNFTYEYDAVKDELAVTGIAGHFIYDLVEDGDTIQTSADIQQVIEKVQPEEYAALEAMAKRLAGEFTPMKIDKTPPPGEVPMMPVDAQVDV